jgi:hypothetical protein
LDQWAADVALERMIMALDVRQRRGLPTRSLSTRAKDGVAAIAYKAKKFHKNTGQDYIFAHRRPGLASREKSGLLCTR